MLPPEPIRRHAECDCEQDTPGYSDADNCLTHYCSPSLELIRNACFAIIHGTTPRSVQHLVSRMAEISRER